MTLRATIIILIAGFMMTVLPAAAQPEGWDWVQPERVYSLLQEGSGIWLVDVSGQVQFEQVHIESSMNISPIELRHRNYPMKKLFVLVDSTPGQRTAREAAEVLAGKGHTNVHVLAGGLPAWEMVGLPVVRTGEFEPYAVSAADLSWALENQADVRVYDISDEKGAGAIIPGSQTVAGGNADEQLVNLRKLISGSGSLSEKLRPSETIVLISSAAGDAEEMARQMAIELKRDVRYLMGGYEAYGVQVQGKTGEKKTVGQCPTCPLVK